MDNNRMQRGGFCGGQPCTQEPARTIENFYEVSVRILGVAFNHLNLNTNLEVLHVNRP